MRLANPSGGRGYFPELIVSKKTFVGEVGVGPSEDGIITRPPIFAVHFDQVSPLRSAVITRVIAPPSLADFCSGWHEPPGFAACARR